jgi:hypothetical protein
MSIRQEIGSLHTSTCPWPRRWMARPYDPTGDTVQMAFTDRFTDPPAETGRHPTGRRSVMPTTRAASAGPSGTVELAEGRYMVWVKITKDLKSRS